MPYGDTMFGVSIVLNKYNVPHECVKYTDKYSISSEDMPFITIYKGEFVLVVGINKNDSITLWLNNDIIELNYADFMRGWNGSAIIVASGPNMHEDNLHKHTVENNNAIIKASVVIVAIFALIIGGIVNTPNMFRWDIGIIGVNGMGIVVSYLLLKKQLHIPSRLADKICSLSSQSHCDRVTESSGSTIFGLVKLGEVGFGFFVSNVLILLCFPSASTWLSICAVLVLPFTFWSLWYQKFKVHSWCVLCLMSLAAMWLQALLYWNAGTYSSLNNDISTPILILATYVLMVLLTNWVMSEIKKLIDAKSWQKKYEELMFSDTVIQSFEKDANVFDISAQNCSSLIFGNPKAEKIITVFSNPYCGPCALMHNRIKDLPLNCIKIQYVLTFFSAEKSEINKAIIASYQQLGADRAWQILTKWFDGGQKLGMDFFSKFNIDIDTPEVNIEFNKQTLWAKDNRLYGTPTDLINGREIVWPYSIENYIYIS